MAVILNASTSSGLVQTADTSGELVLQSNGTTELTVTSTGVTVADNLLFNSGYGSSAVAYGCRAWVNFNGTGTPAIRASGNVSSITDGGTGIYTVNMTTALPDVNYSRIITCSGLASDGNGFCSNTDVVSSNSVTTTTSAFGIFLTISGQSGYRDPLFVSAAVFR
jgi:hypothetical protein